MSSVSPWCLQRTYDNTDRLADKVYLAFPTPYYHYNHPGRQYLNLPTLAIGAKTNDGTIETQLATSRDGKKWTRYRHSIR